MVSLNEFREVLKQDFSSRSEVAIDRLVGNYKGRGMSVQVMSYDGGTLPIHGDKLIAVKYGSSNPDSKLVTRVEQVARATAQTYGLKALIQEPGLFAGGIYVSWMRLDDKV